MNTSYAPSLIMKSCRSTSYLCTRLGAKGRAVLRPLLFIRPLSLVRPLLFIFALLFIAPAQLRAEATLPTVSTDGNEVWYYIYLDTRSKFLMDNGDGANATLGSFTYNSSALLWKVTGDNTSGYTLTSKLGNTLYMTSTANEQEGVVKTAATPSSSYCSTFILKSTTSATHTTSDYLLISPSANTATYFNQYGGTTSSTIGTWAGATDVGSTFTFLSTDELTAAVLTTSSTPFDEKWYYLPFTSNNGADYIRSQGDATKIRTAAYSENDSHMLWKFVGDNTNGYTLTNNFTNGTEKGITLYFTSVAAYNESTAEPVAYGRYTPNTGCSTFTFVPTTYNYNSTAHGTFNTVAFAPTSNQSLYINRAGTGSGKSINLWVSMDENSYIKVTPREEPDLYLDSYNTATERRVVWYDIQLNSDNTLYLTSSSTDDNEVTWEAYNADNNAQRWRIMVNDDGTHTLINRLGYTLYVKEMENGKAFYAATSPTSDNTAYNVAQKVYEGADCYIIGTSDDADNYYFLSYTTTTGTARKHGIGLKDDDNTTTTTTTTTATVSTTVNDASTMLQLVKSTIPTVTSTNTHYVNRVFDNSTPSTTYSSRTTAAASTSSVNIDLTARYANQLTAELKGSSSSISDNVYVRWHLEDSTGATVPIATGELKAKASTSVLSTDTEDALYWSGTADEFASNYTDILHIVYAPADTSVLYRVVCEVTAGVTDVTSSPTAVTTKYIVRMIKTKKEALDNFLPNDYNPAPTEKIKEEEWAYSDRGKSTNLLTIDGYAEVNCNEKIREILGSQTQYFYVRWYLTDAAGNVLADQSGISANDSISSNAYWSGSYVKTTSAGLCYYPSPNSGRLQSRAQLSPKVTLPTDKAWSDINLVCVVATDTTGWYGTSVIGDRTGVYTYFGIAADPVNIAAKFTYSFTAVDPTPRRFKHTSGYAYRYDDSKLGSNGQQLVHSWHYTYYVRRGEKKSLIVPVDSYEGEGSNLEPASYWRWFDYNTDHASLHLSTDSLNGYSLNRSNNGTLYDQFTVSENDPTSWGLFKWDLRKSDYNSVSNNDHNCFPNQKNVAGVIFNAPSEETWVGDTIACDVSRYRDFKNVASTDTEIGSFTEPTLSLRYYYYVYPARKCAEDIMNALITDAEKPFEDNGNIVIGIPTQSSTAKITLRLNLKSPDSYYFYPRTSNAYSTKYTAADFDTSEAVQGKSFTWRVYTMDGGKAYYCNFATYTDVATTLAEITLPMLVGNYDAVDGSGKKRIAATAGRNYTILVYLNGEGTNASGQTNQTILARFNCIFSSDSGILLSEDVMNHTHRTNDYLDENYVLKGEVTFDDFEGMTYDAPQVRYDNDKSTVNNSWNTPLMWDNEIQWDFANYGFVYPGLWSYNGKNYFETTANCSSYWNARMGISPYHGDYTLIKSMNMPGVSTVNSANKGGSISNIGDNTEAVYCWWRTNEVLYDRTHVRDNTKYGHFLYVDASDESRPIATLEFNANLCTGSAIVASIAVADLTSGESGIEKDASEAPQLVFKLYAFRTEGTKVVEKKLVQSFAAPNFKTALGGKNPQYGQWYQVYARTYINSDVNVEDYTKYMITIDNYAANTNGADYAIDDIRIYTRNNRVEVLQEDTAGVDCALRDTNVKLKLRVDNATIRSLLGLDESDTSTSGKPFYYRIYRASDNAVLGADGQPADEVGYVIAYENGTPKKVKADDFYYTVWYSNSLSSSSSTSTSTTTTTERKTPYIEQDAEGNAYFVFADSIFTLPSGIEYYISACEPVAIYNDAGTAITGYEPDGEWGDATRSCTNFSNTFNNVQPELIVTNSNGTVTSTFEAECGEESADITMAGRIKIANAVWGGTIVVDYPLDWFVRRGEAIADTIGVESTDDTHMARTNLVKAVVALRTKYPTEVYYSKDYKGNVTTKELPTDYDDTYTQAVHDTLQKYINRGELFLTHSDTLRATFRFESLTADQMLSLLVIPAQGTYTDSTDTATPYTYTICPSPMTTSVTVKHSGPKLLLGMSGVDYPDAWEGGAKYLRLGIEQLKELLGGKEFRLPIYDYRDASGKSAATGGRNVLTMRRSENNDNRLQITESNDPTFTARFTDTPTIYLGTVSDHVEDSSTSLLIDLSATTILPVSAVSTESSNTLGITADNIDEYFHEGYEYTFQMRYIDAGSNASSTVCDGYTDIVVQIVPAYVTWTNRSSSGTNWNRDGNWRRSRGAGLYKETQKYDATDKDATKYTDYYDEVLSSNVSATKLLDTPDENDATYTKPTAFVPMKFTRVTIPSGVTSPNLNTYERNDALGIITNLVNTANAPGTTNINLYLMLKVKTSSDGVYDVEPFYANTCKEIYFTTGGKLRNQHYLDYESAWVDFETNLNDWTIWTSPLRSVYAGDMFVPVTGDDKTNGRQLTEAFEPISFTTDASSTTKYSRTEYPVYQRSWDKTNVMVITADGDARDDYDAYVTYPTADEQKGTDDAISVISQWSHNYNDVSELYYPGQGIALYAGKPEEKYTVAARFRLPKANTSYDYYDYTGTQGTVRDADAKTLDRSEQGILAISESGVTQSHRNGQRKMPVQQTAHSGDYYLVGNPYMASLNMREFFLDAYNPAFYKKYWVLEDGQLVGYGAGEQGTGKSGDKSTLGSINPMTAFFIKKRSDAAAPDSVWFAPAMTGATTYGTSTADIESSTARLRLTVEAGAHKATASVIASTKADNDFRDEEDVEMLFDSNLEDRPVVYTVAGQMTTQINRMADLTNVPLGFHYSGSEPLKFSVTGVDCLSKPVYLRDAKTGTCTALADNVTVEVVPNAVGRYFLTSEATPQRAIQTSLRCYSLEAGKVVAATSEGDLLTEIAIYDTAGRLQHAWNPNVTSCTFASHPGIYLITLNSEAVPEGRTFKVLVK